MTTASTDTKKQQLRERGTLQETLPSPALILSLFFLICTAIATFLAQSSLESIDASQSSNDSNDSTTNELVIYNVKVSFLLKAGLGVISSMIGNLYSDPSAHLVALTAGVSHGMLSY
jgi:hypothetical protein